MSVLLYHVLYIHTVHPFPVTQSLFFSTHLIIRPNMSCAVLCPVPLQTSFLIFLCCSHNFRSCLLISHHITLSSHIFISVFSFTSHSIQFAFSQDVFLSWCIIGLANKISVHIIYIWNISICFLILSNRIWIHISSVDKFSMKETRVYCTVLASQPTHTLCQCLDSSLENLNIWTEVHVA